MRAQRNKASWMGPDGCKQVVKLREETVEMEMPNHARQLLLQLNQQRAKGFLCDVIIVVEDALFRAHKNILAASSIYFKSLMLHDNLINLDTDMVSPSIFRQVLDFIYTGKLLSIDQSHDQNLGALLTAASYLQLHDLAALCRKKLKSRKILTIQPKKQNAGQKMASTAQEQDRKRRRDELVNGKGSDDEIFVSSSQGGGKSEACGKGISNGVSHDHGLDLTRKSLSQNAVTEEVSPQCALDESPHPTSESRADSFSSEDGSTQPNSLESGEPTDLSDGICEASHVVPDLEPAHMNSCQVSCKKDWTIIGSSSASDHSSHSTEDVENGKDQSDESGQSENEGGTTGVDYRFHSEEFKPAFGDNLYVCIPCGKGFPSSEQLNSHVEAHAEEELVLKDEAEDTSTMQDAKSKVASKCSTCGKSFKDPASLRQHEKVHWLARPFPCHVCGKMFTQRGTMTRHMRSHLDLKPFACGECDMRFTRQYRLTEHMRVHSGEKPYECQLCGCKFTQQRNLINHLRMHTSPT